MTNDAQKTEETDPYKIAVAFGVKEVLTDEQKWALDMPLIERVAHWAAWRAARNAASHLLAVAKQAGITEEQYEKMYAAANEVAYD